MKPRSPIRTASSIIGAEIGALLESADEPDGRFSKKLKLMMPHDQLTELEFNIAIQQALTALLMLTGERIAAQIDQSRAAA